jgi:hypothetical protein
MASSTAAEPGEGEAARICDICGKTADARYEVLSACSNRAAHASLLEQQQ